MIAWVAVSVVLGVVALYAFACMKASDVERERLEAEVARLKLALELQMRDDRERR